MYLIMKNISKLMYEPVPFCLRLCGDPNIKIFQKISLLVTVRIKKTDMRVHV